jgi:RND superfamily putative drug exporter
MPPSIFHFVKLSESETTGVAGRIGAWSLSHRRTVLVTWLVLFLAGGFAAATVGSRLTFQFNLPGQPAYITNQHIIERFGNGGDNAPLILVATGTAHGRLTTRSVRDQFEVLDALVSRVLPGARIASFANTGSTAFISPDRRTAFAFVYPRIDFASSDPYSKALPVLTRALKTTTVFGTRPHVTGATILSNGGQSSGNSVLIETLLAGVGALVVLAVVFGSLLALVPLLTAAIAIPTTFLAVDALTHVFSMSTLVQNIIALIGLGVAIDYALLITTRWREERQRHGDIHKAVLVATSTAGNSVLFSGLTVAVSLAALALTDVPFLRSIGLAGMLVALASVAVATTLLPVLLDSLGPRLEWPRKRPARTVSPLWTRIAKQVVEHRIVATLASLALLGALIAPAFSMHLGEPQARATAVTAPADARAGYEQIIKSGLGAGILRPTEILYHQGASPVLRLQHRDVLAIAPASWRAGVDRIADAWSTADASTATGTRALSRIRAAIASQTHTRVGGTLAEDQDFIHALYGPQLLIIVAVIVLVTFLLLAGRSGQSGCRSKRLPSTPSRSPPPSGWSHSTSPTSCSRAPPPAPSPYGFRSRCSLCCSASPWITRSSSSPASARNTEPTTTPPPPQSARSGTPDASSAQGRSSSASRSSPSAASPRPTSKSSPRAWQRESSSTPRSSAASSRPPCSPSWATTTGPCRTRSRTSYESTSGERYCC